MNQLIDTDKMTNRPRLPLQPRNPNVYGSSGSLKSAEHAPGNSESSNDINKARIDYSSSRTITSIGFPVELGNEKESSLVTYTGTHGAPQPSLKRTMSGNSGGSRSGSNSSDIPSSMNEIKNSAPSYRMTCSTQHESDQDLIIEEKRKRVNGEGYSIHQYLRGRLLGKGGFAKVYMCTALDTNKQYAVKVVPKANLVKSRARQKVSCRCTQIKNIVHLLTILSPFPRIAPNGDQNPSNSEAPPYL
jgi:hypothetical protein